MKIPETTKAYFDSESSGPVRKTNNEVIFLTATLKGLCAILRWAESKTKKSDGEPEKKHRFRNLPLEMRLPRSNFVKALSSRPLCKSNCKTRQNPRWVPPANKILFSSSAKAVLMRWIRPEKGITSEECPKRVSLNTTLLLRAPTPKIVFSSERTQKLQTNSE